MKKNWGPVWFELRAQKGQSDLCTFMYSETPGGKMVHAHFPHREADGLGRLLTTLEKDGLPLKIEHKKLTPPPRWMNLPLLVKGLLKHPVAKKNPWKSFVSKPSEPPDRAATITLTSQEDDALKSRARAEGVSPSFLMLSIATDLIRDRLYKNAEDEAYWLFPVDLRGAFPEAALNELTLSFVPLHFTNRAMTALQSNYQKLRQQLKSGEYWAYYALYHIGDWIGRGGMKFLVDRTHEKSFWMGSFSDLGSWTQPELCESAFKDRVWSLSPPGSPSYPFGLTNIEWCGKRSITMRIHPSITDEDTVTLASELLEKLRKTIVS
ncbi:MAG: hypothetical protein KF789_11585 [Bdellovibrionaceae bacterium]|nr:hypothetical protein [Pseudobdellovibrionaceae bacterium]